MTRAHLHERIESCLLDVAHMLGLVETAVRDVTGALLRGDVAAAELVMARDGEVNDLYQAIDATCLELLAQQAPVAGDLRAVLAVVRMIGDVERAGDLALTIAKVVARTAHRDLPAEAARLVQAMGEEAAGLLAGASSALRDLEPDSAERLDLVDDVLDELAERAFSELPALPSMTVELALQMAVIARCYERIGDHAVGIAERVEFLVTGSAHSAHVGL